MELIPVIAEFFGVTSDTLLGVDENIERKNIEQYLLRFQKAISQGKIYDCISIAREGVAEYPNNFVLLNHYAKKKDETDPRQIERALSLLDDWYERKGK